MKKRSTVLLSVLFVATSNSCLAQEKPADLAEHLRDSGMSRAYVRRDKDGTYSVNMGALMSCDRSDTTSDTLHLLQG